MKVGRPKAVEKIGRPKDFKRSTIFELVLADFLENNDETVTVSDLIDRMGNICDDPYGLSHMKNELENVDGIVITQIGKEQNIVTTKSSAAKVLSDFHSRRNSIVGDMEWTK